VGGREELKEPPTAVGGFRCRTEVGGREELKEPPTAVGGFYLSCLGRNPTHGSGWFLSIPFYPHLRSTHKSHPRSGWMVQILSTDLR